MGTDKTKSRDKSIDNLFERLSNIYPSYPYPNEGPTHWKGRPIISNEYWEHLSGVDEILAKIQRIESRPEVIESLKINMDFPEEVSKELDSIKREIDPTALDYFPSDIITVVFNPSYSCPKAPDLYKLWVSDYRELLTAKGYRSHEYDGSWWTEEWKRLNTDWRARVGASEK
jgi:hypothetical protein